MADLVPFDESAEMTKIRRLAYERLLEALTPSPPEPRIELTEYYDGDGKLLRVKVRRLPHR